MPPGESSSLIKRILIQDSSTMRFLRDGKAWTDSIEDADSFLNSSEAVLKCLKLKLDGVQVLITFGQRRYDLVLPIHERGDNCSLEPRAGR
jgi:hypothetical protein